MPSAAVSAFQAANPAVSTVARSQQTTVAPVSPSAPFTRQSRMAQQLGFTLSGLAFGAQITQQLPAAGGYLRALSVTVTASGGTTTSAAFVGDAPFNILGSNFQLKDPTGNPMINVDSYSLYLINLFSGQGALGTDGRQNPTGLPSYSPISATTGAFTLRLIIPLEFDSSAYCSLPDMNASANFVFQTVLATQAQVLGGTITTPPTLTVQCNLLFWTIPQGNPLAAPPDVGSSAQWTVATGGQNPTTGASLRVRHPSPGTYIHTLVAVLRDNTGARVNAFPTSDLSLWIDDYPLRNVQLLSEHQDQCYTAFGVKEGVDDAVSPAAGNVKTNGVIVYTFRQSVQVSVSQADTSDELLPTAPSTKLEIGGTWGTISNSPGQLTFLTGWLYPANPQRIPWTHLAS